jgi:hypothetical protein
VPRACEACACCATSLKMTVDYNTDWLYIVYWCRQSWHVFRAALGARTSSRRHPMGLHFPELILFLIVLAFVLLVAGALVLVAVAAWRSIVRRER